MVLVTAIIVTELSRRELVADFSVGTAKRRYEIMFRGTVPASAAATHDFRDQWPEISDIEGISFLTVANVPVITNNTTVTWSAGTATIKSSGAIEARFTVVLT